MPTLVEDLHEVFPNLPEEFLDTLLERCVFCNSKTTISETLTSLMCSNPRCSSKISERIDAICKKLGILGMGPSTRYDFIETYSVTNPMDIFDLKEGMLLGENIGFDRSKKVIDQVLSIKNGQEFLLWEAVAVQNLPGIQTSAQKIFRGYDDIYKAYEDIEDGGIAFINDKLGHSQGTAVGADSYLESTEQYGVRAISIYNTLIQFKDDIIEGVEYLNIVSNDMGIEVTAVVSDQVGGRWSTKNEFYNFCKEKFKGRYHFNFAGSVSMKSTEFLIWAGADGSPARHTSKVSKVTSYNEKGACIPILTGEQFVEFMESWDCTDESKSSALTLNDGVEDDDTFSNFMFSSSKGGLE